MPPCHLHLLDVVSVALLHVLPQRAAVIVRRAAPVLAHVPLRLLVHALDVDLQLALVAKSLKTLYNQNCITGNIIEFHKRCPPQEKINYVNGSPKEWALPRL